MKGQGSHRGTGSLLGTGQVESRKCQVLARIPGPGHRSSREGANHERGGSVGAGLDEQE